MISEKSVCYLFSGIVLMYLLWLIWKKLELAKKPLNKTSDPSTSEFTLKIGDETLLVGVCLTFAYLAWKSDPGLFQGD